MSCNEEARRGAALRDMCMPLLLCCLTTRNYCLIFCIHIRDFADDG
jgi:hypothetical protein